MIDPWFNLAVALALGLLIGVERERSKGEGPGRGFAGIRTFALAALTGALAAHLGGPAFLAVATGGIALLTSLAYFLSPETDRGLTTEIALIATPLLGGLAMSDSALAAAVGVVVAVVLAAKASIHHFVKRTLSDAEVADGLVFGIATLVIWPKLPDRFMGPFQALNPHSIWLLVILMLAIGAAGHVATRLFGPRFGLPIAGLASGFVSSTATIGSMGGRARQSPETLQATVAGAALSTVATFVQMALLLFAVNPATLAALAPMLVAGGLAAALYGGAFTLRALKGNDAASVERGRAFSVWTALVLAGTMAAMLVIAAGLREWLGSAGILLGAAVSGLADTHSAAISVASLAASGKLAPQDAVVPILAAMTTNTGSKIVMAVSTGSAAFAARIVPGLVLAIAAAWAALLLV